LAEFTAQVAPAVLHVLDQRLCLVLRENGDLADPRVHAVRQDEVDDAELAAEGRRGLAAMRGEIPQPLPAPAGHDDGARAARRAAAARTRTAPAAPDPPPATAAVRRTPPARPRA